jgi:GNAT superfamily N-acetyltransferase
MTTVEPELEAAVELDCRLYVRAARQVTELPQGWAYRHCGLPRVHMLNGVRLRAPLDARIGTVEVEAIADAALAGLDHRQVVITDAAAAERLSPRLEANGWERRRTQFMVWRADPAGVVSDPRARAVTEDELRAFQRTELGQPEYGTTAGLADELVAALAAVRAGTPVRGFGAGEAGGLQSSATLFLDPDVGGRRVAMLESVATLREHRQRGLARAAVCAAVRAAGEWGAGLIVVPADADDWPQLLYAGLGFVSVGRQLTFTRPAGSG